MRFLLFTLSLAACVAVRAGLLDEVTGAQRSAHRVAELIVSADVAKLDGESEDDSASVVVRDAAWIQGVARSLRSVSLGEPVHCLCTGWQTASFYREGRLVARVAAIHGNQLRMSWGVESGDFPIDEGSWKKVSAALEYREKG